MENLDIEKGKVKRLFYRSVGPMLNVDCLVVEIEFKGEIYTNQLPNKNWSYHVPALQMMAFCDVSPSDFDFGSVKFERDINVPCVVVENKIEMTQHPLREGQEKLKKVEWFNPEGKVWNSQGMNVGGSIEPGTGNQGGVPQEEIET